MSSGGARTNVHTSGNSGGYSHYSGKDANPVAGKALPATPQPQSSAGTIGHIQIAGSTVVPKGVALPKTSQEMDMQLANVVEGKFADPKKNVEQLDLRPGLIVADFGSGSGLYALALAEAVGETGQVFAVDVQRDLLTRLKNIATQRKLENIEVIWGDIEEIEGAHIARETLDMVLISNTLFQVENKINVFKEAWRVLKPQGALAIIDWSESFSGLGPPESYIVRPAEVILLATDNGFMLSRDFNPGDHHYGIIFVKTSQTSADTAPDAPKSEEERQKEFVSKVIAQELI